MLKIFPRKEIHSRITNESLKFRRRIIYATIFLKQLRREYCKIKQKETANEIMNYEIENSEKILSNFKNSLRQ